MSKKKKAYVYRIFVSTKNEKLRFVAVGQNDNAKIDAIANSQRLESFMSRIGEIAGNDHFDFKFENEFSGERKGAINNVKTIKGQLSIKGQLVRHVSQFAKALIQDKNDEDAVEAVLHIKEKAERAKQNKLRKKQEALKAEEERERQRQEEKQKRREQYQFFGIVRTTGKNKVAYFFEDEEDWIEDDLFHGYKDIPSYEYEEGVKLADDALMFDEKKIKRGQEPISALGLKKYKIVDNHFDVFVAARRK